MTSNAEAFLRRAEALATPAWVGALRRQGVEALARSGLPNRRVEAYRYTDLTPVARAEFGAAPKALARPELPAQRGRARMVFVDGVLRADLSTLPPRPLSDAAPLLGTVENSATAPVAALNAALAEDGMFLDIPAGENAGLIELVSIVTEGAGPIAFHPRHVVRLGEGASVTILETCEGPDGVGYLHNPVFEVVVAEGATCAHTRIQREGQGAYFLSSIHARIAAGGTYDNFTLNAGAKLARNEIHSALEGPKAACHMNGAQLVGQGQLADTTTFLHHAAPDCASRQTYKSVLTGNGRGVFQGKILVAQVAQRTDGYQMNQALLLSEDAEMDAKPQLEIYADDVKCSHGATIGALDENQLFYLRSRGIPEKAARAMLVQAFLTEAVDGVADETCRAALDEAVMGWWQGVAA
ncbi:Fe-S cluster assembly protein SufD [Rhodovarius crocodyli]|uniref:Fe-S cluster assembly protein SufD n=1 Tax=Rhodovarius crocodyli TaxID=1979269 RepID=A0A437MEE8_9PROT|nr:Fe-S cluster assembly protein SufD [Rhodovarius crocodyli]RVT95992.1 Fe-S cluster assembly protein SufD [Rhodovarius crocodyli]